MFMASFKRQETHKQRDIGRGIGNYIFSFAVIIASVFMFATDGWSGNNTLLGDRVWNDSNQDGIQDDNELGIQDVGVILKNSAGDELKSVYTDADGFYSFLYSTYGREYIIEVDESTLPDNFVASTPCSTDSDSSVPGNDQDSNCNPQSHHLGYDEKNPTIDFGYHLIVNTTSIGDRVWGDLNEDGIQDCDDTNGNGIVGDAGDIGTECNEGIEGVMVELVNCQDSSDVIATVYTDADGFYLFEDVTEGEYCVLVNLDTVPIDFCGLGTPVFTIQNGGGADIDSDVDPITGMSSQVYPTAAQPDLTVDAGIICLEPIVNIGDRVWEDLNGDGIQNCDDTNSNGIVGDAGDTGAECNAGIEGVMVELVNCQDSSDVMATAYTDADGFYLFEDVAGGDYCVLVNLDTVPVDFCELGTPVFTTRNGGADDKDSDVDPATGMSQAINVAGDQSDLSVDAGIFCSEPASIGDRVWTDLNGNGVQDCDDTNNNGVVGDAGDTGAECNAGIEGVMVELVNCQDSSNVMATAYTDADGFYLFEDVADDDYCVLVNLDTVPVDVCELGTPEFTAQNAGSDEQDSDVDPATGMSQSVVVAEGQADLTVDAGILCPGPASIGDRVWEDLNGNGVQDCDDTNNNALVSGY